ncbi:MAG: MarR family winged helix-turn-helix transcriptional regulator [Sphaerochaeta sp.]|nr:MarR family winged helix-turn-helix transcriptional regulator [Sphaerochaeta sp.]
MKQQSIGRLIAILHRQSQIFTNKALKEFSLTSAEYPFLFALYHTEGQTQEELSSYLYIDKAATARIIKSLIAKGFVTKEQDAQDKRCNRIFLTEKAKGEQGNIHQRVMLWNSYITEDLDDETYQNVFAALQTMVAQVEKKSIPEHTGVRQPWKK